MSNSKGQHTVEKIGGTPMSATETLRANVLIGERRGRDLYGRIFVVSAFSGVTDRLLEKKKTGEPGVYALFAGAEAEERWSDALSRVGDRMRAINHQVLEEATDRLEADAFVAERVEGVRTCLHDLQRLCSLGPFRLEEHLSTIRELVSAL